MINFYLCHFSGGPIKSGTARLFWDLGDYPAVAVADLGDATSWNEMEEINGAKENVRIAAASMCRQDIFG